jgi:hypothetical protein
MTLALKVSVLRSPEFYWKKACEFTQRQGGFTAAEIAGCTSGVANSTVRTWAGAMVRQGELKIVGSHPSTGGRTAPVYAVVQIRTAAPAIRRANFIGLQGRAQQQMWNAMRALPNFSLDELAVAASTEERPIHRNTASRYVAHLTRAGVLVAVKPPLKGKKGHAGAVAGIWRLLKSRNSGPAAPRIHQCSFVYDPNRDEIVGGSEVFS